MVGRPLSWGSDGAARPCRGLADIPGKGLAGALRAPSARVLPGPRGYLRQEPCRGLVGVLDKEPCRGLVGILGKESHYCLVFLFSSRPCRPFVFTKICMPPWRRLPSLGSNVVDGVGTPWLKGGSLVGVGQVAVAVKTAPARALPGESHLAPLLFMLLVLSATLVVLRLCFLPLPR